MDKERKLEEEILASFEQDEWSSVPDREKEIQRYVGYAKAALVKDKRVNIRISSRDLEDIRAKAAEEGIPYQTLIVSVLHKFVTGRLVDASTPGTALRSPRPRTKARADASESEGPSRRAR